MIKLALVLATAAAFTPASAIAQQAETTTAATAKPAVAIEIASDPRMIAAIRHANAKADAKCGAGAGLGITDLQSKMAAKTCRRHIVNAAMLDAEGEIGGH